MEDRGTTKMHEQIEENGSIHHLQSANKNSGREEQLHGKYKDTKCRKCTETIESQEHVLETCTGIHDDNTTKIQINDIFDSNTTNLKATAKQLKKKNKCSSQSWVERSGADIHTKHGRIHTFLIGGGDQII